MDTQIYLDKFNSMSKFDLKLMISEISMYINNLHKYHMRIGYMFTKEHMEMLLQDKYEELYDKLKNDVGVRTTLAIPDDLKEKLKTITFSNYSTVNPIIFTDLQKYILDVLTINGYSENCLERTELKFSDTYDNNNVCGCDSGNDGPRVENWLKIEVSVYDLVYKGEFFKFLDFVKNCLQAALKKEMNLWEILSIENNI